jgi:hypothetical protein
VRSSGVLCHLANPVTNRLFSPLPRLPPLPHFPPSFAFSSTSPFHLITVGLMGSTSLASITFVVYRVVSFVTPSHARLAIKKLYFMIYLSDPVTRVLGSGIGRQSGVERVASVIEMIALNSRSVLRE